MIFDPNNIFNIIFVIPILNVLMAIYKILVLIHIPGALGLSLVILTVLIRLVLTPLTISQLKSAYMMKKLKPQLDKLGKKYKNDKTKLHQEQLKLYQQAGINPAAGCLPLLLQMPVLIALYNLFFRILGNGNLNLVIEEINKVVYLPLLKINSLDLSFFGFNLAHKPSQWATYGWYLILIPILTAVLQYVQTKMMTPTAEKDKSVKKPEKKSKDKGQSEDMAETMQKQMSVMMPLMIGFFAYSFPLGLALYWNTFTVFGILQQRLVNKHLEGLESQNAKKKRK